MRISDPTEGSGIDDAYDIFDCAPCGSGARGAEHGVEGKDLKSINSGGIPMDAANEEHRNISGDVVDASTEEKQTLLVFDLAGEYCGLDAKFVQTIVHVPPRITRVPNAPYFVRGVINLRGTVVPVLDCAAKMDFGPTEQTSDTRVVVAEIEGIQFGFLVDAVREVREVSSSIIEQNAPRSGEVGRGQIAVEYILGVAKPEDGRLIVLIDLVSLFDINELLDEEF